MGNLDNEDLAKWITDEVRQSKVRSAEWRKQARECYSFYSGKQWSDDDQAVLEQSGRPTVVFNRTARTINAIAGLEVQNRQEVRYIPRTLDDAAVNETLTGASKWVRDNCDAEDEESEAFQDALICGIGWTDTSLDYEVDPNGMIIVERDDPLCYFWDSNAKKRNIDDAAWRAKVYVMSPKAVQEKWPDWDGNNPGEHWLEEEEEPHDATPPFYDGKAENKGTQKTVEVLCFQWYEKDSFTRVQTPDGQIIELSSKKFGMMKESLDAMGMQYVTQKRRKYYKAYLIGKEIIEKSDLEVQSGFTYRCITGLRDRNNNSWFGLVALMLDPQRWANKWLSQIMHILNSNSKGGLFAETGAFVNQRKAEKEYSNPQAITMLNDGGLAKIMQKEITQMPTGIEGLLKYALESINDVPGINTELLGLADRQQAGVLENSRKQAGVTMLAIFFDSLRRYRKEQGRILADFIKTYISDGRLVRIVGPDGERSIPLLKDNMTFEYDVIVDDAPTSTNQKEKTFAVLSQLMPMIKEAGVPMPVETIDYLPLPDSLIQKWKEQLKPDPQKAAMQKQQQQQEMMQQAQMQAQMQAQAEGAKEQAKGEVALKVKQQSAMVDLQAAQNQAQIDAQVEQMKSQISLETERQKAEYAVQLEQMKQQHELAMKSMDTQITTDFDRWKVEMDNATKVLVAQISAQTTLTQAQMSAAQLSEDAIDQTDDPIQPLLDMHGQTIEAIRQLADTMSKPRKTKAVRGKDGKIEATISEIS